VSDALSQCQAVLRSNVRREMNRQALTWRDLSRLMGFSSPAAIYDAVQGQRSPTLTTLVKLATALGTTPHALLTPSPIGTLTCATSVMIPPT